jgi:hypothetical protein
MFISFMFCFTISPSVACEFAADEGALDGVVVVVAEVKVRVVLTLVSALALLLLLGQPFQFFVCPLLPQVSQT